MKIPVSYQSKIDKVTIFRDHPVYSKDIVFTLTAEVEGAVIYKESFADTASLEENGLRKAEHAVDEEITEWDALIQEDCGE